MSSPSSIRRFFREGITLRVVDWSMLLDFGNLAKSLEKKEKLTLSVSFGFHEFVNLNSKT